MSNIDFAERTITVNQQIVDKSFTLEKKNGVVKRITIKDCVKPPKSISSYRTIKVPSFIMDELRIRKKENEAYFQTHPKANTYWKDYVCIGKGGEIKSPNTIANALKRICSGNGLPQISPHGLRHMCATILLESGKDLDFICHVLGHKSMTTTFDIYCGDMDGFSSIQKLLSNQLDPINKFEMRLEKVV